MKSDSISEDLRRKSQRKTETPRAQMSLPESPGQQWLLGLLLVAVLFIAYQPACGAGFIWDDDNHLTKNPCIVGPLGFKDIWTSSEAFYYPLVLTSFWVLHAIWGLDPLPYHLVNIAMHAASAVLLWRVLRRLNVPGAWLGAALWALHPVQVESVAWITELKNTQSGLFFLLAMLFFLRWHETTGAAQAWKPAAGSNRANAPSGKGSEWDYALALFCAILAVLSKASTVMLPVALMLCWWWRERRWQWHNVARLLPFFFLSAVVSAWAIWEQRYHSGALGPEWAQTWPERGVIAGKVVWFYLGKLVWPHPLIFIYPRWTIDASHLAAWLPAVAAVAVLLWSWRYRDRQMWPVFFAFSYFVILLFPVLGFFNVYFFRYSFVGDHFQYLASMGPMALAGSGVALAFESLKKNRAVLRTAACGVILVAFSALTWQQSGMYRDIETLYRTTIQLNPASWLMHNNLGVLLVESQPSEAVAHFNEALRLKPDYADAEDNLGNMLSAAGNFPEAMAHYETALQLDPQLVQAENNLGLLLDRMGRSQEAILHYEAALRLKPDFAEAENNLGVALKNLKRTDEAIAHFRAALQRRPDSVAVRNNLADALSRAGRMEEAVPHYEASLRLNPNDPVTHHNFGFTLFRLGRLAEAIAEYEEALRLDASNAETHNHLGEAFQAAGEFARAKARYEEALRIQPGHANARQNLDSVKRLLARRGQ